MAESTRESAQRVVLGLRAEAATAAATQSAKELLSAEVVERVFDIAWRHQFDEDRATARRLLRQLVSDAVEEHLLEQGEA
jgi:hypothetical protein